MLVNVPKREIPQEKLKFCSLIFQNKNSYQEGFVFWGNSLTYGENLHFFIKQLKEIIHLVTVFPLLTLILKKVTLHCLASLNF